MLRYNVQSIVIRGKSNYTGNVLLWLLLWESTVAVLDELLMSCCSVNVTDDGSIVKRHHQVVWMFVYVFAVVVLLLLWLYRTCLSRRTCVAVAVAVCGCICKPLHICCGVVGWIRKA